MKPIMKLRKLKNRTTCAFCRYLAQLMKMRSAEVYTPATENQPVPYPERILEILRGPALVWPYYNIRRGEGPFEIAPDSNSYRNPNWVEQLPSSMPRHKVIVNLLPALTEEWLANEKFRIDPERWILDIVARYEERGVCFRGNYATEIANMLRENSDALRYNWTLLFFYVAIIKKLLERRNIEDAMRELVKVSNADVPRAGMMLSLGALCLFLKGRQRLCLPGDSKPAYSFVQRFFAFQPGRKGEVDHLSVAYLRNRSLDLGMYYFFPAMTSLGQRALGETVIATHDVPLRHLFFRILPFLFDPARAPAIPTSIAQGEFAPDDGLAFVAWRSQLNQHFEPPLNQGQKLGRLENLAKYAKGLCERTAEKDALDEVWHKWAVPYLRPNPQ